MSVRSARRGAIALIVAALAASSALAAEKAGSAPLLPGSSSKEPISINADKLEYFDKEQKAIYTGNVVAVQGDSQLTCSVMTLFLSKSGQQTPDASAPAPAGGATAGAAGTQVKHMEAAGPVTVVSKTQVATGDRGSYDKDQNRIWLFGNVTMSDSAGNVTKGDKLTYNLTTGEAVVEVNPSGRVQSQFIPGSGSPGGDPTDKAPGSKKSAETSSGSKTKTKTKPKATDQ
jgi:lipopolysaccharide export system protein LptA